MVEYDKRSCHYEDADKGCTYFDCDDCKYFYKDKEKNVIRAYDDWGNVVDMVEYEKQIRAEIIDELTQKVEFEEKWLFDCYRENGCKYSSNDINIAFDGIKNCLRKLKGE